VNRLRLSVPEKFAPKQKTPWFGITDKVARTAGAQTIGADFYRPAQDINLPCKTHVPAFAGSCAPDNKEY